MIWAKKKNTENIEHRKRNTNITEEPGTFISLGQHESDEEKVEV
jgi:hypothetical protein